MSNFTDLLQVSARISGRLGKEGLKKGRELQGKIDKWSWLIIAFLVTTLILTTATAMVWSGSGIVLIPLIMMAIGTFLILWKVKPSLVELATLFKEGRSTLRYIGVVAAFTIGVGLYFSIVPAHKDPWLVLPVIGASIIALLLGRAPWVLTAMMWSSLVIVLVGTIFFFMGGREEGMSAIGDIFQQSSRPPSSVRAAAMVPRRRDPLEGGRPCRDIYTTPIPVGRAVQDEVVSEGNGIYTRHWTANNSLSQLLMGVEWPSQADNSPVRRVRVTVTHVSGHLDLSGTWDPSSEDHMTVSPSRDYRNLLYCPGRLGEYPLARDFLEKFWPAATGIALDRYAAAGAKSFVDGPIELLLVIGDEPLLFFLNPNPPGNGRLHSAELRIEISPA